MNPLLKEIRRSPMLWLLAFVPVVFAAAKLKHDTQAVLFVLSVLAIVLLAALLSHATESVAVKTGDAAGGLLNATLGNLTELVLIPSGGRRSGFGTGCGNYKSLALAWPFCSSSDTVCGCCSRSERTAMSSPAPSTLRRAKHLGRPD
jgi:hypothetical protein